MLGKKSLSTSTERQIPIIPDFRSIIIGLSGYQFSNSHLFFDHSNLSRPGFNKSKRCYRRQCK